MQQWTFDEMPSASVLRKSIAEQMKKKKQQMLKVMSHGDTDLEGRLLVSDYKVKQDSRQPEC